MKTNVIPFAIIAIVGIFAVVILSSIGVNQRADIQNPEEAGGEVEESMDPEEIFANSCSSCHGGDLTGGVGPDLTSVGGKLSEDDIQSIIMDGADGMPPALVPAEQAAEIAKWLGEMK